MSRSRRKTPIRGITTSESEKADKLRAHRAERRKVRAILGKDPDGDRLPHRREISNPWMMDKDGKHYLGRDADPRDLRK